MSAKKGCGRNLGHFSPPEAPERKDIDLLEGGRPQGVLVKMPVRTVSLELSVAVPVSNVLALMPGLPKCPGLCMYANSVLLCHLGQQY